MFLNTFLGILWLCFTYFSSLTLIALIILPLYIDKL
jgi:hypothetical protein